MEIGSIDGVGAAQTHRNYAASENEVYGALSGTRPEDRHAGAATGKDRSTPQTEQEIRRLKERDAEVRRHEQAHLAVAGVYARGGTNYTYTIGPDGRLYATGGEVSIDASAESTPEATIEKMQTVKRAAVAPSDPSAQDRAVYAAAVREENKARQKETQEEAEEARDGDAPGSQTPGKASRLVAQYAPFDSSSREAFDVQA